MVYYLVLDISPWLLQLGDINVKNTFVLKKWNYNNIAKFTHVILQNI